jgi:hypothetical protein
MLYNKDMRQGRSIPTTKHPVGLTLYTRAPEKWVLVDTETGQTYQGNSGGYWDQLVIKERGKKNKD